MRITARLRPATSRELWADSDAPAQFAPKVRCTGSPTANLLPIPAHTTPNKVRNPGIQPWVPCLVEVPGIEPGSAQT